MSGPYSTPSRSRVIVVEDDEAVRAALSFSLDLEGFEVETYSTAEALLLRPLPSADACLVLDERLPGVSGLEALRQLRRRGVELPALLITSNPGPTLRAAAATAGVRILEKPLLDDALKSAIRGALA